jgi:hypothetical protein
MSAIPSRNSFCENSHCRSAFSFHASKRAPRLVGSMPKSLRKRTIPCGPIRPVSTFWLKSFGSEVKPIEKICLLYVFEQTVCVFGKKLVQLPSVHIAVHLGEVGGILVENIAGHLQVPVRVCQTLDGVGLGGLCEVDELADLKFGHCTTQMSRLDEKPCPACPCSACSCSLCAGAVRRAVLLVLLVRLLRQQSLVDCEWVCGVCLLEPQ